MSQQMPNFLVGSSTLWMRLEDEFIEELTGLDQEEIIDAWSELNQHNLIFTDAYSNSRCIQLRRG